ncbi:MAG: signal recognition particle-docking protein FtsY [Pseudomonadales bacterium]|jgi:fused signal recognition particle receptor|nr:signal recognition particle-docking protein FtsY [Pseudomonadales bacterium]MBP6228421.1 signal recognition particle-docking protein FtsY [Pseudomonadales bacterium]
MHATPMKIFRRNKAAEPPAAPAEPIAPELPAAEAPAAETVTAKPRSGLLARLRAGLGKTRSALSEGLGTLFLGRKTLDDELLDELETRLLMADVGMATVRVILDGLVQRVRRRELSDPEALFRALKDQMTEVLAPASVPLQIAQSAKPFVILMVGVNGAGKTTTIGKLARRFQAEGKSVMLAAGDTFRAAAVEQLQVWGERNGVPVIAQQTGSDSASVIFDALQSARARGCDVLIADTAGRLHVKSHLMDELRKIVRVMQKIDPEAPHEVMLVLDAGTGQNGLPQARSFREAVGVSGIVLTKLDGTAKGGIVFSVARELGLPIRFIGIGEALDDLRPFEAGEFVAALFDAPEH